MACGGNIIGYMHRNMCGMGQEITAYKAATLQHTGTHSWHLSGLPQVSGEIKASYFYTSQLPASRVPTFHTC